MKYRLFDDSHVDSGYVVSYEWKIDNIFAGKGKDIERIFTKGNELGDCLSAHWLYSPLKGSQWEGYGIGKKNAIWAIRPTILIPVCNVNFSSPSTMWIPSFAIMHN